VTLFTGTFAKCFPSCDRSCWTFTST